MVKVKIDVMRSKAVLLISLVILVLLIAGLSRQARQPEVITQQDNNKVDNCSFVTQDGDRVLTIKHGTVGSLARLRIGVSIAPDSADLFFHQEESNTGGKKEVKVCDQFEYDGYTFKVLGIGQNTNLLNTAPGSSNAFVKLLVRKGNK